MCGVGVCVVAEEEGDGVREEGEEREGEGEESLGCETGRGDCGGVIGTGTDIELLEAISPLPLSPLVAVIVVVLKADKHFLSTTQGGRGIDSRGCSERERTGGVGMERPTASGFYAPVQSDTHPNERTRAPLQFHSVHACVPPESASRCAIRPRPEFGSSGSRVHFICSAFTLFRNVYKLGRIGWRGSLGVGGRMRRGEDGSRRRSEMISSAPLIVYTGTSAPPSTSHFHHRMRHSDSILQLHPPSLPNSLNVEREGGGPSRVFGPRCDSFAGGRSTYVRTRPPRVGNWDRSSE